MADRVVVAVFAIQNQAYDAAKRVQDLDQDGTIELKRGAIASKDAKGNLTIPDTKDVGKPWGLLGGGIIGGLLGLLLGPVGAAASAVGTAAATGATLGAATGVAVGGTVDLAEFGLDEDFVDSVSTQLEPGETALIAEVNEGSTEPIDQIVARYGGRVYRTQVA